jgi:shikimate kinase
MDHPVVKSKIYLVGMMGSGKSFWAGKLGHHFILPAYDLDKLIEQDAGKTIREIFEQEGEDAFRKTEARLLRKQMPSKKFIMATGGGAPCFMDNMDFMKNNGIVVWLNPPIDELVNRVSRSIDTRPVLGGIKSQDALKAHMLSLLEKRVPWYEQAHVVIEDDSSVEKVVEKIKAFEKTIP